MISLARFFLLGKEGFKELKSKLFGVFKRVPSGEPISRRRHRRLTLLALNVLLQFAALVFPIASHYGVASDGTFPKVLGLYRQPEQLQWFVGLLAAAEVLFFAGSLRLGRRLVGPLPRPLRDGLEPSSKGLIRARA